MGGGGGGSFLVLLNQFECTLHPAVENTTDADSATTPPTDSGNGTAATTTPSPLPGE